MAKRTKRRSWRNYRHEDRFDQDEIDKNVFDTEQLRTRVSRWRERLQELEEAGEPDYTPEAFADYPRGVVLNMRSGHHYVRLDDTGEVVDSTVRGVLKLGVRNTTTVAAPGDKVHIERQSDGSGLIRVIVPRTTALSRPDPVRPHLQDLIVTNVDQLIIVSSVGGPSFWPELVDRYLVFAEYYELEPLIVINKADQAAPGELEALQALYHGQLGYRTLITSTTTGQGVDALQALMKDRSNVVTGLSGVGKSSLLNAIQPGLNLLVRPVNVTYGGEGTHTTRTTTLHPLDFGGFVADTPGIRSFGIWNMTPEEVDYYFVEFRPLLDRCRFTDCTHHHEPGCAILAAVESGEVSESRYKSFVILYAETNPAAERPF